MHEIISGYNFILVDIKFNYNSTVWACEIENSPTKSGIALTAETNEKTMTRKPTSLVYAEVFSD